MKEDMKDIYSLDQRHELEVQGIPINNEELTEANFICNIRCLSCWISMYKNKWNAEG